MAKRVLVLGASGFIGTYIIKHLEAHGHIVTGTYCSNPKKGLVHLDLLNVDDLSKSLGRFYPEVVVFLAGSKDVKQCEKYPEYAIQLNVQSVRNYIKSCELLNIKPYTLYFSTDYVFDGVKGSYRTDDVVGAKTIYGLTKILAERLFLAADLPAQILRVSAVMGRQGGFFRWLEESLQNNKSISLFSNTYFSPTSIGCLCRYLASVVDKKNTGEVEITHLNDGYRFSRFQFGRIIAEKIGKPEFLVTPEEMMFDLTGFQPDISILPSGMTTFKQNEIWNELEDIY